MLRLRRKYLRSVGEERDLLCHALAIMHTPQYRFNNQGALLSDWPRIPLPATADLLAQSATLGRRLAELLDAESAVQFGTEWTFLGALKLPRDTDLNESLQITADWGRRGQGSTVMPAPGRSVIRLWTEEELTKVGRLAAAGSITPTDALALLGDNCVDVYLNNDAMWSALPVNVWGLRTGRIPGAQEVAELPEYRFAGASVARGRGGLLRPGGATDCGDLADGARTRCELSDHSADCRRPVSFMID